MADYLIPGKTIDEDYEYLPCTPNKVAFAQSKRAGANYMVFCPGKWPKLTAVDMGPTFDRSRDYSADPDRNELDYWRYSVPATLFHEMHHSFEDFSK